MGAVVGKTCYETLFKCEHTCPFCQVHKLWETNEPQLIEAEYIGRFWKDRWVSFTDDLYIHYIADITERKLAEKAIRKSERKSQILLEISPICTKIIDLDLNLQYMSSSGIRELKIDDITEHYGKPYPLHFFPDSSKISMTNSLKKVKQTGKIIELEGQLADTKGNKLWYQQIIVPVNDDNGKLDYILVVSLETTERKRMEENLKESENRFKDLALTSADWIWEVDNEGKYVFASGKVKSVLGYSPEELIGKTPFDFMSKVEAKKIGGIFEKIASEKNQIVDLENWNLCKDGKKVCILTNGMPMLDEKGDLIGYRGVDKDITERKLAEEKIKSLSSIVEQSTEGMALVDLNGNLIFANKAWCEMHGYKSSKSILGKNLSVFHNKEQLENDVIPFNEKVKKYGTFSGEVEHITKDGNLFPTLMTSTLLKNELGNPYAIAGIAKDITERKLVEKKLHNAIVDLENIFNISPGLICVANANTGYITICNPAVKSILGISVEEFTTTPFMEFIHPDDRQITIDEISKQQDGSSVDNFENRYRCKDGSYKWLAWQATDADKNGIIYGVASDITLLKLVEEELIEERASLSKKVKERTAELSKTNVELAKANKMKDEFLANMSHELRTPLNSVIALSNVLRKQAKDKLSEEENNYLDIVERNGQRLLLLINDILDLSKIVAGKIEITLEFISVGTILLIIKENLQPLSVRKGLALTLNVPDNLPKVENDESKLQQIITNVIGNAVKFTRKGGVDISVKHDSENIFIEVKDTGIGISNEMLPHIFDEFRMADSSITRQYGGTGLGLAIAKKMIVTLGGDIEVKSELDKGSVFTITIPIKWAGEKQ